MAKRTIKINIKLPAGITANKELIATATKAANDAVSGAIGDLVEAKKLAAELATKGIQISAEELISRRTAKAASGASAQKSGPRKRVVLSEAKRKELITDLKAGATVKDAAKKYGVSIGTVMSIKTQAGLTKKRK